MEVVIAFSSLLWCISEWNGFMKKKDCRVWLHWNWLGHWMVVVCYCYDVKWV